MESSAENTKITDLNNLVNMIVDYYCFKNNVFDEDQDDNEGWKKGTKYDNQATEDIIPDDLDKLIHKSFIHQLKKFSKE